MAEIASFWNQEHPLSKQAEELFDQLVPAMGKCGTLQGELLRASSKIGYDWYNNGWGCNNWSGAVGFLRENFSALPLRASTADEQLQKCLDFVHQYSHGEPVFESDRSIELIVTKIHEIIVSSVLVNDEPIENNEDMYNYQEEDYQEEDYQEESDEDYWGDDEEYDDEE